MSVITRAQPRQEQREDSAVSAWNLLTRIIFRFCVVHFGLYCLFTQIVSPILGFLSRPSAGLNAGWLMTPIVDWTAAHIVGVREPLVHVATASSDRTYDWILLFCLLVIAAVATLVWSVLDRRRGNYVRLLAWFRLFLRFNLAGQLLLYGVAKLMLTQMPSPPLTTLVTPFGELTPMGLLWSSVGAAPAYEILIGSFEAVGGLLLLLPRTTTLGAVLGAVGLTQVFVLNLTYDVPVKSMSLHLLLMSGFLLAPELGRLLDVLLSRRPVGLSTLPPLFRTSRLNRIALFAQIFLALWITIPIVQDCVTAWGEHGEGRPKPPLFGVWNVERLISDGQEVAPLTTDERRWRRVFFEYPDEFKFQRMNDSIGFYRATVDLTNHRLELTRFDRPTEINTLALDTPAPDRLTLSGTLDGHRVEISLRQLDLDSLPLLGRTFHWVQDYPYNPNSR
ncbi:DoxX family protein [Nocardia colli]|uniref:DoxX family protein n=1 Tax=Nocardia colli TaxID=2545717 RepID=A0A5N0EE04_9NOCA|nr:DoxX family protein [Nocardia colli]